MDDLNCLELDMCLGPIFPESGIDGIRELHSRTHDLASHHWYAVGTCPAGTTQDNRPNLNLGLTCTGLSVNTGSLLSVCVDVGGTCCCGGGHLSQEQILKMELVKRRSHGSLRSEYQRHPGLRAPESLGA